MRILTASVFLLLCSCAVRDTTPPVAAPTIPAPAEAGPVDLGPVDAGAREVEAGHGRVSGELEESRRRQGELSRALAEAEERGSATAEDLAGLRRLADRLRDALEAARAEVTKQVGVIRTLLETVQQKTGEAAAADQERRSLRATVAELNERVEGLTANAQAIAGERETARVELEVMERSRNRWRLWAALLGLAVVGWSVWHVVAVIVRAKTGKILWGA